MQLYMKKTIHNVVDLLIDLSGLRTYPTHKVRFYEKFLEYIERNDIKGVKAFNTMYDLFKYIAKFIDDDIDVSKYWAAGEVEEKTMTFYLVRGYKDETPVILYIDLLDYDRKALAKAVKEVFEEMKNYKRR